MVVCRTKIRTVDKLFFILTGAIMLKILHFSSFRKITASKRVSWIIFVYDILCYSAWRFIFGLIFRFESHAPISISYGLAPAREHLLFVISNSLQYWLLQSWLTTVLTFFRKQWFVVSNKWIIYLTDMIFCKVFRIFHGRKFGNRFYVSGEIICWLSEGHCSGW